MRSADNPDVFVRVRELIRVGVKQYGSYRALADVVGISHTTLNRIAQQKLVPSLRLVDRLAKRLGARLWLGAPPD